MRGYPFYESYENDGFNPRNGAFLTFCRQGGTGGIASLFRFGRAGEMGVDRGK